MLIAKSEIESSGIRFPKFFVFSVYFVVKALPIQRMAGHIIADDSAPALFRKSNG
jgi:hypothetical protein